MIEVKDRVPLYPGRTKMTPVAGQANVYDMVRADQPQQVGTALNRRTMQLLQADIRTYPVKAGEIVQAGDVVDVVGGAVGETWEARPNNKSVFASGSTNQIATCKLSEGVTAVAYYRSTSVCARICKVVQNEISYGPEANPTSGQGFQNICCVRISDTSFLLGYTYESSFNVKIGLVSSNGVIGFIGGLRPFLTSKTLLLDLDGKIFVFHDGKACVCSMVGTTITFGTEYAIPGTPSSSAVSAARLPDSGSNKRVCVCYSDVGDGSKGKAIIATINASNVVTWGEPKTISTVNTSSLKCCYGDGYVAAYGQMGVPKLVLLNVSGSAIQILAESSNIGVLGATGASVSYCDGKIVITGSVREASAGGADGGGAVSILWDGHSLVAGDWFVFNAGANVPSEVSSVVINNSVLLAYNDRNNSDYGTATLMGVRGDQVAGSFENTSSQAIALQGGTGGQNIDLIFDGTAELPGITAGTSITSSGVQGYCPQDGWLWVKPEWAQKMGLRVATGSYMGTQKYGSANPNKLIFDFAPKLLIVTRRGDASYGGFPWVFGCDKGKTLVGGNALYDVFVSWSDDGVSWYTPSGTSQQLNDIATYDYIAIG